MLCYPWEAKQLFLDWLKETHKKVQKTLKSQEVFVAWVMDKSLRDSVQVIVDYATTEMQNM